MSEPEGTARERMLEAGAEIWNRASTTEVFGGLSVTGVARSAGVTRTTFYAHWPTPESYLHDLVQHLSIPVWGPRTRDYSTIRESFRTGGIRLVDRLLAGCDGYIDALLADPEFPLRMGLAARSDDPDLAPALRTAIATSDAYFGVMLQRLDVTWGREPRRPIESHHLPAIFAAVADGLAVRHRLDPDRFPVDIFGLVVLSLLLITTRNPGDPRDLNQILGTINDWPTDRVAPTPQSSPIGNQPLSDREVRGLVEEARRLNSAEGWMEVSLPRLATLTSTPESRVVRAFGSTAGLALAIFLHDVTEQSEHLESTDDALADLRALLDIRADVLRRSSSIASAVVSILSGNFTYARPHTFSFDPRPRLVAAVRRAQEEGHLDATVDPDEFTGVLEYTVLFSNLGLTPRLAPTIDAVELVLRGAMIAPVNR